MYTQEFYQQAIEKNNKVRVEYRVDKEWQPFDNTDKAKINTATKTMGDFQVSGNLILDRRFIIIDKH